MIDVLEQIEFLNSLLSDDTPTYIKESIEKRIGILRLDVLAFEQSYMSEIDAKIQLATNQEQITELFQKVVAPFVN